jgi:hypothetical protein
MASSTSDAAVEPYCVDFCKGKLTVLGVDVAAAWKPKVSQREREPLCERMHPEWALKRTHGPLFCFFLGKISGAAVLARPAEVYPRCVDKGQTADEMPGARVKP